MSVKNGRGRKKDWHAWAFKLSEEDGDGFCHWAEPYRPETKQPTPDGKWVKVRFVEVGLRRRGQGTP